MAFCRALPARPSSMDFSSSVSLSIFLGACELFRQFEIAPETPCAEDVMYRGPDIHDTDDDQCIAERVVVKRGSETIADETGSGRTEPVADERLDEQQHGGGN